MILCFGGTSVGAYQIDLEKRHCEKETWRIFYKLGNIGVGEEKDPVEQISGEQYGKSLWLIERIVLGNSRQTVLSEPQDDLRGWGESMSRILYKLKPGEEGPVWSDYGVDRYK